MRRLQRCASRYWMLLTLIMLSAGCFAPGGPFLYTPTPAAVQLGGQPVVTATVPAMFPTVPEAGSMFQQTLLPSPLPTNPPPVTQPPAAAPTQVPPIFPTQGPAAVETPMVPTTAPANNQIRVFVAPTTPQALQAALVPLFQSGRFIQVGTEAEAQVRLLSVPRDANVPLMSRWVYVPVMAFVSVADSVSISDMQRFWRGEINALAPLTETGQPPVLVATPQIIFWLNNGLGPAAPNVPIESVPLELLAPRLWELRAAWSIISFEQLNPTLKALNVDGVNILSRSVSLDQWAMVETFGFVGDEPFLSETVTAVQSTGLWLPTNRDPTRLTSLITTGVTALTRATAYKMEVNGIHYPARDIAPFLAEADILHTSNEVSFANNCPKPNFADTSLIFCSSERYFELLKHIGLDVVELTGNHVNDWGIEAMQNSLALYRANGIPYFGGGANADDARRAAIVAHNGNKIAFIGCNPVGPRGAWATESRPGAAQCEDGYLAQELARLRSVADIVVMTIQFQEYYRYDVPKVQQDFFRKYAAMGAHVVIGSQAHQPQGFAFTAWEDGAFIHFGVGNLFFDQMQSLGTRQMFADKLVVYQGKLISVQLFTGIIEDYARPRPMNATERVNFLKTIFRASGW
ncbi:MAG: hypothetical protein OHK0023_23000 [Anaerolineae bacterium]